jgi:hypothetical protein
MHKLGQSARNAASVTDVVSRHESNSYSAIQTALLPAERPGRIGQRSNLLFTALSSLAEQGIPP